jgi:hypothetical protein
MVASFQEAIGSGMFEKHTSRIPKKMCTVEALRDGEVFALAPGLSSRVDKRDEDVVRRSILIQPDTKWIEDAEWLPPHKRAEILVAAVLHTFTDVWARRLAPFTTNAGVDRTVFDREGAKSARHVLGMCIRALDWLPPVDVSYEDYLRAILSADEQLVPEDTHGYRSSFAQSFAAFGIDAGRPQDKENDERPLYNRINVHALRSDPEESARFIWHNAHVLGIDLRYQTEIDRVVRSLRTGPDGLVIESVHVDYSQRARVPLDDVRGWAEHLDPDAILRNGVIANGPGHIEVDLWGGGVLIFDQFARLHAHIAALRK